LINAVKNFGGMMENIEDMKKPRSLLNLLMKTLAVFLGLVVVAALIAHFAWKYSGSGQWEFEHEKEGVKVYSLKAPGAVLKTYKVIGKFKAQLDPIMKVMRDPSACDDVGCYESYIIEKPDFPRLVTYTFRYPTGSPFKPREYVVISEFIQDPKTKEIYVDYKSIEGKLAPSDCCVRVKGMHNKWRFIPKDNGDVEVQFVMDHDPGGFIPYFLVNMEMTDAIHTNIPDLQKVLDKEKYKNADVDYVKEVGEQETVELAEKTVGTQSETIESKTEIIESKFEVSHL
jgi:hypothetical protein